MFGYIVLFSWPVVVIALFKWARKPTALIVSLLVGYLFLPELLELDLPLIPSLNKHTLPAISAFLILLVMSHKKDKLVLPGWIPKSLTVRVALLVLIVGAFFTVQNNGDTLVYGRTVLPSLSGYDAFALILQNLMALLPFFLARKFLAHPSQHRAVLVALALSGALYSILAFYEVRMSPQLNKNIYGFYQHSFLQHVRGNGFRPMVFLGHGLSVSLFLSMACLATAGLLRISPAHDRARYLFITLWVFAALFLSKSLGAFVVTVALLPVIFLARRLQLMVATGIALIVLLYPIVRGTGLIPLDGIVEWANGIDPARAASFAYRLANEEILLAKAEERPIFGWGIWGRSFIYDEAGNNISVTDGYWIIILGFGGWIRYLAEFSLLCLVPVFLFWKKRSYDLSVETSVLTLLLVTNLLDLIPNAGITPVTWLIAGCLWGRLELGELDSQKIAEKDSSRVMRTVRYSRFDGSRPPEPRSPSYSNTRSR